MLVPVPMSCHQLGRHTPESIDAIYSVYRDCVKNFHSNLNQMQVLLYVYKQFFNVKNESHTAEYSAWVIDILVKNLVLRFIGEQLSNFNAEEQVSPLKFEGQSKTLTENSFFG